METFKSKEVEMNHPSYMVFASFADLTRMKDRIPDEHRDKITVTPDTLEGDYNGMHMTLKVVERIPTSKIVMKPVDGFPVDFTLNFIIEDISPQQSKMQIVVEAKMNFIMKAMVGSKIQSMLDQITDSLSQQVV